MRLSEQYQLRVFIHMLLAFSVVFLLSYFNRGHYVRESNSTKTLVSNSRRILVSNSPKILLSRNRSDDELLGETIVSLYNGKYEVLRNCDYYTCNNNNTKKNTFVVLIRYVDVDHMIRIINNVDTFFIDYFETDFTIFHQNYFGKEGLIKIRNSTMRSVVFINVDSFFNRAPMKDMKLLTDLYKDSPNFTKKSMWSYQNMIRFWVIDVFDMIADYNYYFRLDDDSKLLGTTQSFFTHLETKRVFYLANTIFKDYPGVSIGVPYFATNYVKKEGIKPKNKMLWDKAFDYSDNSTLAFYNNFEVVSIPFFRQSNVRHFADAVLLSGGIYKYRWGDAIIRYLTVALFIGPDQYLMRNRLHIRYCHPC